MQNFVNTVVTQFLNRFDHAKVDPSKPVKSKCKFRQKTESWNDLIELLEDCGVNGHYEVKIVDYCKVIGGADFAMYHVKGGLLYSVFEVDLFEENSHFKDGEEYLCVV